MSGADWSRYRTEFQPVKDNSAALTSKDGVLHLGVSYYLCYDLKQHRENPDNTVANRHHGCIGYSAISS